MPGFFDDTNLTFHCPNCGAEITKPIGAIKAEPQVPCPSCNVVFDADDFVRGIKEADEAIDKFTNSLDDLRDAMEGL